MEEMWKCDGTVKYSGFLGKGYATNEDNNVTLWSDNAFKY